MSDARRRYPGARPFEEEQADIFEGRHEATRELYRLVRQEKLVVLYARSGVGKSSLLRAGLLPLLRAESNMVPVFVRLYAAESRAGQSPVATSYLAVQQLAGEQSFLGGLIPEDFSLWRILKEAQLTAGPDRTILLIFDQFEELFSYPPVAQLDFRQQLAEALQPGLPQRYWDILSLYEGQDGPLSDEERQQLQAPLRVHALMAIREDRMHLLGGLSDYLPMISGNWFELRHLNIREASQAIERPAAATGKFVTEPFTYSPAALERILAYLTQGSPDIESTQLQIICDALDQRIADREKRQVTVRNLGDLNNIVGNYYWNCLNRIPGEDQRLLARRLIEEDLIFEPGNRRLSLFGGIIRQRGISADTLRRLVDSHLLRAESDLRGGYNYELSHDSLLPPILRARQDRLQQEEAEAEKWRRQQQEAALQEARRQTEKERRLRAEAETAARQARRRSRIAIFSGLLALAVAIFAVLQYLEARQQRNRARISQQEAEAERSRAEEVLDRIYFHKDEFGAGFDSHARKWGYLDREPRVRIPFEYDFATHFGPYNMAEVEYYGRRYYIDTSNNRYLLARSLTQLQPATGALDLAGEEISMLPPSVANYPGLRMVSLRGSKLTNLRPLQPLTGLILLDLRDTPVRDLSPLAATRQLQWLSVARTEVTDLQPLAGLDSLQWLDFSNSRVSSLAPLRNLRQLRELHAANTAVSDPEPLTDLTRLHSLNLRGTQVADLGPLAGLRELQSLHLDSTRVADLRPLERLTELRTLNLYGTQITSYRSLGNLRKLRWLNLGYTAVRNIRPLAGMQDLEALVLYGTPVRNLHPLRHLKELQVLNLNYAWRVNNLAVIRHLPRLRELNLTSTAISSLEDVVDLPQLRLLEFGRTGVSDLTPLAALSTLEKLYAFEVPVSDAGPLAGLQELRVLSLLGSQISSLQPVGQLRKLQELYLQHTAVNDLEPLSELSELRILYLDGTAVTDLRPLFGLPHLQTLSLQGLNVSPQQIAVLQARLPDCSILGLNPGLK